MVIKKDRSREVFDRQKLLNGMLRACEKRPVSYEQLDAAVSRIKNIKTTLCALCFDFLYFRQHICHKALTAKTRINSHTEHHKQIVEEWENSACRCVRLNYKSGYYAVICDFI